MNVDTHFHIFDKSLLNETQARYSVDYNASIDDWAKVADAQQITGGVIVQPSFLGFDNTLLLEAIKQNPRYLRGVGVTDPKASQKELLELSKQGVCGIRLNLAGDEDPLGTLKNYEGLINLLKGLNMHLQIHHDDGLLNGILLAIPNGIDIVIDHFGRPQANDEFEKLNDGIRKHRGNIWVKLSAQYRTPNINHQTIFEYWLKQIGASRLLWGSDWPHTRFEATETYESQMKQFLSLTNSPELRQQILSKNPRVLYWT
ncbi:MULTISPECIES: amidohydrolase [unclassified Polynucleobacter]|uniref:amidohydrolase family protein n=1 Tax=unclassified Polynucleobacter TaxID=2640945 RepID=UPI001BFCEA6F|nr:MULTISPECIES: amidohydrolase family protein [unclassified Polynucleobacter]MBU3547496.1 amidohydrolase family protein [Polynucleobacter sp. P1-05-14]QWD81588.1 amidohydrolase family protein [Polynucleobacter sp. MWH-S4W17]